MESNQSISNSHSASRSLFPAYSTNELPKEGKADDKDWLSNSSFTPANYEEAVIHYVKSQDSHAQSKVSNHAEDIKISERIIKKPKKKKEDRMKYAATLDLFKVSEEESIRSHLNKKTFIEDTGLSFERAFRIDPKFDLENAQFDHFERTKIAKYKLRPQIPVGLCNKEKSLWVQPVSKKASSEFFRYFSQKALKKIKQNAPSEIVISKEHFDLSTNFNYISLSSKGKKTSLMQNDVCENFDGVSIGWKLDKKSDAVTKLENEKVSEASNLPLEFLEKIIFYNKKVTDSPHDIQLWLDFVRFQDELYKVEQKANTSTESSLIEKKISILDKALKYNPKSVSLNISKLKLCQNLWKMDKLMSVWENLLFINTNSIEMWQGYLHFILTHLLHFNASLIQKAYSKCLQTLSNLSEGIIQSHEPPRNLIPCMLDIFSQLCFILRNGGYAEKALALYQSLIELNIFCDESMKTLSASEQISCFEPFWDSGASRIGEDGAIGWAATVLEKKIHSDKIVSESDLNSQEDEILYRKLPLNQTWLEFEKLRETCRWVPWRPNPHYDQTDDDVDDIDRCVSFDDVSKFLFRVIDEEHKFILVQYFIIFLGFNFHELQCNNVYKTRNNQIDIEEFYLVSKKLNSLSGNEFSNPFYFQLNIWTPDRIKFVNNVFHCCEKTFSKKYRTLLSYMWLKCNYNMLEMDKNQFKKNISDLKSFGKDMLKKSENRNCLLLWSEYLRAEQISNRLKAKKTFLTLLTSSTISFSTESVNMKEFWFFIQSFISISIGFFGEELEDKDKISSNEIIWILTHIGCKEKYVPYDSQSVKPTMFLKAVAGFKSLLETELQALICAKNSICYCADPCSYSTLDCAKCYVLLLYFAQGIDAAVSAGKNTTVLLESKMNELSKSYIEHMEVFLAQLINYHTWNSNSSIKPLQISLHGSVELYPSNSQLLLLLVKLRSASSVVNPTRRFWAHILKEENKLQSITWLFAIASELSVGNSILKAANFQNEQDLETSSCWGVTWKIRSMYERALKSQLCTYIAIFWRSYIKFEVQNGEIQKAKGIFHRAIQNCGWCKDLLMDGIKYFPEDLKQILDFMNEKQIRVHTPLEEVTLLMEHAVQD